MEENKELITKDETKRNINRFPKDFMFQLNREEIPEGFSKSQIATLNESGDKRGTNIKKITLCIHLTRNISAGNYKHLCCR